MAQARRQTLEVARRDDPAAKPEGRLLLPVHYDRPLPEPPGPGLQPQGAHLVEVENSTPAPTAHSPNPPTCPTCLYCDHHHWICWMVACNLTVDSGVEQ